MRKFLFCFLIFLLGIAMYVIVWNDIPNIDKIITYKEVQEAYGEYQKTLKTLDTKNNSELPATLAKLDAEYSETGDPDNVVKQYNDNKADYEELVAYQKTNAEIGSADIYDVEYIWTAVGRYASNNWLNMNMDITESETDLDSEDYIMCDLEFEVVGLYSSVAEFLKGIELDSSLGFQINDFFIQGYSKTARNQTKESNMDTDNIPSAEEKASEEEYSVESYQGDSGVETSDSQTDSHILDVKASFKVYNVPLNRKTITNVKTAIDLTPNILEDGTEVSEGTEETEITEESEEITE